MGCSMLGRDGSVHMSSPPSFKLIQAAVEANYAAAPNPKHIRGRLPPW